MRRLLFRVSSLMLLIPGLPALLALADEAESSTSSPPIFATDEPGLGNLVASNNTRMIDQLLITQAGVKIAATDAIMIPIVFGAGIRDRGGNGDVSAGLDVGVGIEYHFREFRIRGFQFEPNGRLTYLRRGFDKSVEELCEEYYQDEYRYENSRLEGRTRVAQLGGSSDQVELVTLGDEAWLGPIHGWPPGAGADDVSWMRRRPASRSTGFCPCVVAADGLFDPFCSDEIGPR